MRFFRSYGIRQLLNSCQFGTELASISAKGAFSHPQIEPMR